MTSTFTHGTCIAVEKDGVLLLGPSGIGKSDLALRMIQLGARLVADDQVQLEWKCQHVIASAPEILRGKLEIYGLGIVQLPEAQVSAQVPLALVVELLPRETVPERMPETEQTMLLDHPVRRIRLGALHPSTPAKIFAVLSSRMVE